MAFWSKDTKKEVKKALPAKAVVAKPAHVAPVSSVSALSVILRPHITEKSGILSQGGVYTFQVTQGANKETVAKAVKALYKVTPAKIAMINLPAKSVFVKGRWGSVPAVKKAMVTVKKGDKIDFV